MEKETAVKLEPELEIDIAEEPSQYMDSLDSQCKWSNSK
jgi:hypothetical protein